VESFTPETMVEVHQKKAIWWLWWSPEALAVAETKTFVVARKLVAGKLLVGRNA